VTTADERAGGGPPGPAGSGGPDGPGGPDSPEPTGPDLELPPGPEPLGPLDHLGPLAPAVRELLRVLRTRPDGLVPFREVQQHLRLGHMLDRGVREVPLAAISGSLNRTRDFDRAFLPRDDSQRQRMRRLRELAETAGFPAVELYQVGGAYFVVDGHHRVAVARMVGADTIEAHVWEFPTDASVEPGDSLEAILAKASARNFERATGLPIAGDEAFAPTSPAGYDRLLEHIAVHRYFLGTQQGREPSWSEAVASWRDTVYRPTLAVIREHGLLADFPGRTGTDLYLWVVDRLHRLRRAYGDDTLGPEQAVPPPRWWRRWWRRLRGLDAAGRRSASGR